MSRAVARLSAEAVDLRRVHAADPGGRPRGSAQSASNGGSQARQGEVAHRSLPDATKPVRAEGREPILRRPVEERSLARGAPPPDALQQQQAACGLEDAAQLPQQGLLAFVAVVVEDGQRHHDAELSIGEGKARTVRLREPAARMVPPGERDHLAGDVDPLVAAAPLRQGAEPAAGATAVVEDADAGEKVHIYDRQAIQDDLLTQFNGAVFFFKKHLNRGSIIRGVNREDVYEIPLEVIREAIVNAIVHRDYGIRGTSLMVEIYDDRVEITNPGGLPRGLQEKDFGRISIRRNEIIADLFYRMDKVERAGTGIQRMKDSMVAAGLPLPEIKYDTFFTITLRRPIGRRKKYGEKFGERYGEKFGENTGGDKGK